jgi:hypothetical protein
MVKAIIDGRRFDSENGWSNIYSDGAFRKSRGVDYYAKKVKGELRCVIYRWTNWQGESDSFEYLTDLQEIIGNLQQERHPDRVERAVQDLEEIAEKTLIDEL